MDNSGDLSTDDGNSESDGSASENNENSTENEGENNSNGEVKANTANDLGVYDDDDAVYWISDTSYYSSSWSGSGTASDPYLIQSAGDLALLSYMVFTATVNSEGTAVPNTYSGVYFEQTCDIDLSDHYWMPIGGHHNKAISISYCFSGCYDGGGHEISGLKTYYDSSASDLEIFQYTGLFGYVTGTSSSSCIIHDLSIVDSEIVGYRRVGSLIGQSSYFYFSVYNCSSNSRVVGYDNQVGGLIGSARGASIRNCYNSGSVYNSAAHIAGGITGSAPSTTIYNCYNTGDVYSVGHSAGGIAGEISGSSGKINNCFNFGNVASGYTDEDYYLSVGGIVGYVSDGVTISNCYYGDCTITDGDGTTYQKGIGYDNSTGDEGEDSSGVVEHLANISAFAKLKSWYADESLWNSSYAWDFEETWSISAKENDGYPILQKWTVTMGLAYDSDGGYWFYEDGMFPQSVVSGSTLISNLESSAVLTGQTYAVGSEAFAVWSYGGSEYVKVTAAGASGTASDSGCTWFLVEPIRWIVAYGSASDELTSVSGAVSALVVTLGAYVSSSTYDATFKSLYNSTSENSAFAVGSADLAFSVVDSVVYDAFNTTASQTVVFSVNLDNVTSTSGNTSVTSAGWRVASVAEIDALGGAYATSCSDFVAFLLSGGSKTSGYVVDYWTRDLAYELGSDSYYGASSFDGIYRNGVYVTEDGVIMNASLKNVYGARLSVALG